MKRVSSKLSMSLLTSASYNQEGKMGFRVGWSLQPHGGWSQWDPQLTSSCSTGSEPLITHDM